jgi:hypothetical protein
VKELNLHKANFVEKVREMYRNIKRRDQAGGNDDKALLWAAGYADDIVKEVQHFGRNEGARQIVLNAEGARVSLARAEETAYSVLVARSQAGSQNPFFDTKARWFLDGKE